MPLSVLRVTKHMSFVCHCLRFGRVETGRQQFSLQAEELLIFCPGIG